MWTQVSPTSTTFPTPGVISYRHYALGEGSSGCLWTSVSCNEQKFLLPSTFCASDYPFWMNNYGTPADLLYGQKMSSGHIQSNTWRIAFLPNAHLKFNTVL